MSERVFHRLGASGWEEVRIQDLEPDDVIAIYDNGKRHVDPHGNDSWIVIGQPFQEQYEEGLLWSVTIDWAGGDACVSA